MGCNWSSGPKEDAAASEAAAREKKQQQQRDREAANAALNAPKMDPKDFMLIGLKDQTIVKEPGSINGQQFLIEECENCTIYLLDHSAQIFVGPCESSVFIRTSKHMKLIIAAQQLRTRECSDLDILLYVSAGQPVIESTMGVRLGCFQFNYFGLAAQFTAAGLDPWYSEWSNVHDFTASSSGGRSWSYLDFDSGAAALLPPLEQAKPGLESPPGFVTPLTWGNRPDPFANAQRMLLCVAPGAHDTLGFELLDSRLRALLDARTLYVVRSRRVDFAKAANKNKVKSIFRGDVLFAGQKQDKFAAVLSGKSAANSVSVLGFELLVAPDAVEPLQTCLQEAAAAHPAALYVSQPGSSSKQQLELFFENLPVV